MDEARVQQRVADNLLERGVRFKIPAPFFLRLVGKKKVGVTIRPIKFGTLLAMSRLSAELNADIDTISDGSINQAMEMVQKHGATLTEWVATAILNRKGLIKRFSKPLGRYLGWKLTPAKLSELFMLVVLLCGIQDFTNTIRYLNTLNLTRRKEKDLSHKVRGSQKAEQ